MSNLSEFLYLDNNGDIGQENISEKDIVPHIIRKLIRPRFLLNIVSINQRASGQCSSSAYSFNCLKTISL